MENTILRLALGLLCSIAGAFALFVYGYDIAEITAIAILAYGIALLAEDE